MHLLRQALLCKDPLSGYREAMFNKVPEDVINEIIVHFVGPEGSRVNSYSKVGRAVIVSVATS